MYMYNSTFVFFSSLLSGGRVFLFAFSAAGQASLPWVHYEPCLDLGRGRGDARRVKHRLAGTVWQGIAFRLPRRAGHLEHPTFLFFVVLFGPLLN